MESHSHNHLERGISSLESGIRSLASDIRDVERALDRRIASLADEVKDVPGWSAVLRVVWRAWRRR